jgi:ABC-type transport system involved in multi-copper enzyme maturation permease subunit
MQAFLAILRYDLQQLSRSWVSRIWIPLLVVPAVFLIAVAANERELASETMAAYVAAVLAPLSALAVAVLASSAVSGESGIIADSILSRSVTRTEYISAKIIARIGFTLAVYLMVMIPFSYLIMRYAAADTSLAGVVAGVLMVALLLTFLAAFGLTMSTLISNVLVGVLAVLLVIVLSGVALQFLGLSWMSTTAVIEDLPQTFRGDSSPWDVARVMLVFPALTAVALFASIWVFRRKDL